MWLTLKEDIMKKKTGIWLDRKKAIIITLFEYNHLLKKIESGVITRDRVPGETKMFGRFGDQFLSLEKTKKNRLNEQITKYLKSLIIEIKNVEEFVLFGPGNIKNELEKLIRKDNVLSSKLKAVETADSMTENQMVAWLKKFYFG